MASIQDINASIIHGTFTNEQLDSIIMAIKFARAQITKKNVRSLRAGAKVKFTSSRTGQLVIGEVTKVNRKFVLVRAGATNWRVPGSMLSLAE